MAGGAPRARRRSCRRSSTCRASRAGRAGSSPTSATSRSTRSRRRRRRGRCDAAERAEPLLEAPEGASSSVQVDGARPWTASPAERRGRRHRAAADAGASSATPSSSSRISAASCPARPTSSRPLNERDWTGGAFVYVPRGVRVEAPILLTAVTGAAGTALHRRALIVLEEGAEAEVWEQYLSGRSEAETVLNTVVELVVGQNATPALRLRPGPQRALVDLRRPARRGRPRRLAGVGRAGLRLGAAATCAWRRCWPARAPTAA